MHATDDRPGTIDDTLAAAPSPRDRILRAAAMLLAEGGREAVSTRAVSAAAGVQPPTIYRQFGDMQGLLDAVAADGFARYLRAKVAREGTEDPVADLRAGWDAHIDFGLANPALYALMYGDPGQGSCLLQPSRPPRCYVKASAAARRGRPAARRRGSRDAHDPRRGRRRRSDAQCRRCR